MQALVKKLDARVSALEKGGAQSGTTAAPTPESKPSENAKDDDSDDDFDPFADDDDDVSKMVVRPQGYKLSIMLSGDWAQMLI